ncbi:repulsive guidance molecule B isoform X2 [Cherax quadricarinatus]|uniref:repulsive guidance molecule B isoform X2 n=1 Tax=Cherax quadricarinatus TaxID=27406 RepID=UPI0023781B1D|nr:repulsive guidance molecule B-like isoform X2 [Cherax quadricarinatus]
MYDDHLCGGVGGECGLEGCTAAYVAGKQAGIEENATPAYCTLVDRYRQCTDALSSTCRGEIQYHSIKRMISSFVTRYNCTRLLPGDPQPSAAHMGGVAPTDAHDVCQYRGHPEPAHCGLFGDPHLKTFNDSYMTCGVVGAWPLLNTPSLAIQVTNEAVGSANHATATTKVTIIIKGHSGCGSERTYEASTEALPRAFVDGTTWSGGSPERPYIEVHEKMPGEHTLITVSFINATVAVRKIGRYLTVQVTLPEKLLRELEGDDELQLCLQGCPPHELLDRAGAASAVAMSKKKATKLCKEYNITDYYLDSCIFDLVTTGDQSFRIAAQAAQKDLWEHDPVGAQRLLLNCSQPPCVWNINSSQQSYQCSSIMMLALVLLVINVWVER